VLFVLAEYYNRQQKVAWPEQATLAGAAGMSERTLIRVLQRLEVARPGHPHGILRRSRRHAGRGSVTNYHFVEFEQKDDKMGDTKGDNLSPVIRNNDQTIKQRTLPNPPLQGGSQITKRDLRKLKELILAERAQGPCRLHPGVGLNDRGSCWGCSSEGVNPSLFPIEDEELRRAAQELMLPWEAAKAALAEVAA
jgi:hypothetical protein